MQENKIIIENQPKITVTLRCFNQANFVAQAIQSVLDQTYKNLEIIILNNGSSDKSEEIISAFAKTDKRIIYLKNEVNNGPLEPCNQILKKSTGKYTCPLDADNYWLDKDKIKKQVTYMEANPECEVLGTYTEVVDIKGMHKCNISFKTDDASIRKTLLKANQFAWHTTIFKTESVKKNGGYKKEYPYAIDLKIWLKLGLIGKLANLPIVSAAYRMTGTNTCEVHRAAQTREVLRIIKFFKGDYPYYNLARILFYLKLFFYKTTNNTKLK